MLFEEENVTFIDKGSPIRAVLFHAAIPQMKMKRKALYEVRSTAYQYDII